MYIYNGQLFFQHPSIKYLPLVSTLVSFHSLMLPPEEVIPPKICA